MECATITIAEPDPLRVTSIVVYEIDEINEPGVVMAEVLVNGVGSGLCNIIWGSIKTESKSVSAGQYYFEYTLPAGTHEICAGIV